MGEEIDGRVALALIQGIVSGLEKSMIIMNETMIRLHAENGSRHTEHERNDHERQVRLEALIERTAAASSAALDRLRAEFNTGLGVLQGEISGIQNKLAEHSSLFSFYEGGMRSLKTFVAIATGIIALIVSIIAVYVGKRV